MAMCHVLSLVIFVTSCEQFIGERYAGPGRAGQWAEKGMRSWSGAHTWTLGRAASSHMGPSVWAELGQSQATQENHNNYVNMRHWPAAWAWPGHSELRLSLSGKMEKVKSAEVPLD